MAITINIEEVMKMEKQKKSKTEGIFIEYDGSIYELKMTFNHMDIVNAIEEHIGEISIYNFEVKSEEKILEEGMIKKFFPYVGKFKIDGSRKVTNNYFVPVYSELLNILFLLYKDAVLLENSFSYIDRLYTIGTQANAPRTTEFIKRFLKKMEIEILNKYSIEELSYSLDCLIKIDDIEISKTFSSLKQLLETSTKNKERINNLGLNDKFIDAIKVKQKDEEYECVIAKAKEPFIYKMYYNRDKKHN